MQRFFAWIVAFNGMSHATKKNQVAWNKCSFASRTETTVQAQYKMVFWSQTSATVLSIHYLHHLMYMRKTYQRAFNNAF